MYRNMLTSKVKVQRTVSFDWILNMCISYYGTLYLNNLYCIRANDISVRCTLLSLHKWDGLLIRIRTHEGVAPGQYPSRFKKEEDIARRAYRLQPRATPGGMSQAQKFVASAGIATRDGIPCDESSRVCFMQIFLIIVCSFALHALLTEYAMKAVAPLCCDALHPGVSPRVFSLALSDKKKSRFQRINVVFPVS